jgi:hypothetical protein
MREDMNEREQGKVLHEIIQNGKIDGKQIDGKQIAKRLGKSEKWVNSRVRLALKLSEKVAKAFDDNSISSNVADIISSINSNDQDSFLLYISENNIIKDESEVRKAKKRFLNNTIYTIGSEGRDLNTFIQTLKDNGIEQVIDIRYSNECSDQHFSGKFFTEQLRLFIMSVHPMIFYD